MTKRLYLTNQELVAEVEVLHCCREADGSYAVLLAETPFHPQGGGQSSDVGWLDEVEVTRVVVEDEDVIHYTREPVGLGPKLARINAEQRLLHSRLHSAGHVIGYVMEHLGWKPIKAHHWPGEGRIVCIPDVVAQDLVIEDIQLRCDQLIAEDLPCQISSTAEKREIAFGYLHSYACGGTHVASLKQVGKIEIQTVRIKKGEASVRYDVGFL